MTQIEAQEFVFLQTNPEMQIDPALPFGVDAFNVIYFVMFPAQKLLEGNSVIVRCG